MRDDQPGPALAVTGSTGVLGRMVAEKLAAAGVSQRLLVRNPAKAPSLPGAVPVVCSYNDAPACRAALAGVRTLFMVSASESADRIDQHRAFLDSVVQAGVSHVVYTSFAGAAPDATFTLARDHHATEEYLRATGLDHTILRDNLYLDLMADLVGADDVIRGPAGEGRVAGVARADISRVAAVVLLDPEVHAQRTYDLTGPEALTMTAIAALLSARLGRGITFHDETLEEAYASRAVWGAPPWQNDAWVSTYTAIAAGELERVSGHVAAVTDREPLGLGELLGLF